MMDIKSFLERNALSLAMLVGVAGFPLFHHLTWLLPPLIFLMLFFTFCKINPMDLRLRAWHCIVLVCQLALGIGLYYGLLTIGDEVMRRLGDQVLSTNDIAIISQGLMLCILMPTATAAPIIAGKLGGSIQNLTSFTLLSNIATAIIVPLFFPVVNPSAGIEFTTAFLMILRKISPLLLGPFFAAWLLRIAYNMYQHRKGTEKRFTLSQRWATMPFYVWVVTLVILMADLTYTLIHQEYSYWTIAILCIGSLATCLLQFGLGRWIGFRFPATTKGEDYHDVLVDPAAANYSMEQVSRITAGQAFGQKNTTLAIWMAQAYLVPVASMAPAAYIIWQNLFNSFQLMRAGRRASKHTKK
ncbi:MAG: transporter [Paludibacteraceae bacterium]|nr:transporter [Paludibacteraceae bacterium]